jgi:hypothetical protein
MTPARVGQGIYGPLSFLETPTRKKSYKETMERWKPVTAGRNRTPTPAGMEFNGSLASGPHPSPRSRPPRQLKP